MKQKGWIKLHRQILENPLASKPLWAWLWVVLLLKANHNTKKMIWNDKSIEIRAGQFLTGRKELAKLTGLKPTSVERALKYLENEQQIRQHKTTKYRVITILKWDKYQDMDIKLDNRRTTDGQQTDTNKNDKNDKNINKGTASSAEVEKPKIQKPKSSFSFEGAMIIKAFEEVDIKNKRYYSNTTQRSACDFLIKEYGLEEVLELIPKLKDTNKTSFYQITSPNDMVEKITKVFNDVQRKKLEVKTKERGYV